MEKRNTITINKRDILRFLKSELALDVPDDSSYMDMDEDCTVIEVHWAENILPKIKHPEEALSYFTKIAQVAIKASMDKGDYIQAIKAVRTDKQCSLKDAKGWVDTYYPRELR